MVSQLLNISQDYLFLMTYVSTACLKSKEGRYEKDLFRVLDVYDKLGIRNIELGAVHDYFGSLAPVIKYKKDTGSDFILHAFFPPQKKPFMFNLANPEMIQQSLDQARITIDACRKLDSKLFSLHVGSMADINGFGEPKNKPIGRVEAMNNIILNLPLVLDEAARHDIKIAVETVFSITPVMMMTSDKDFEELFGNVRHRNLGILIDIPHSKIAEHQGTMDIKKLLKISKNRIFELHVHKYEILEKQNPSVKEYLGMEHRPLDSPIILKDFGLTKELIKDAKVTLEAIRLTPEEITRNVKVIEEAVSLLD